MEPYQKDPYVLEWETTIKSIKEDRFVTLEESWFYPRGGGQPHDEGLIVSEDNKQFPVVFVGKFDGILSHEIKNLDKKADDNKTDDKKLSEGMKVRCIIDKKRRQRLMRSHTAAHIVSAVIERATGALITGNQLSTEKVRIDFSTPDYDPEKFQEYIEEANKVIDKGLPVKSYEVDRKSIKEEDSLFKLAKGFPEEIKKIRIVEIEGFDRQACGGTHVDNTREIGRLRLLKVENKGSKNRRVYFTLED